MGESLTAAALEDEPMGVNDVYTSQNEGWDMVHITWNDSTHPPGLRAFFVQKPGQASMEPCSQHRHATLPLK